MAKYSLRIKARQLRKKGESVKIIAQKLNVSKSSVSHWVRDIILSEKQLERLQRKMLKGAELGRIRGALKQKKQQQDLVKQSKKEGIERLKNLSSKEYFIAGIALYWAEGDKKNRRVGFCNSDPRLIKFMIKWLISYFGVKTNQLTARVGINQIHQERDIAVKEYWSQITSLPLSQFRKTSFKKTNNQKIYENYHQHYGTLTTRPFRSRQKTIIEGVTQKNI